MSERETSKKIPDGDPVAVELRLAVHAGDVEAIQRLLRDDPALAGASTWLLTRSGLASLSIDLDASLSSLAGRLPAPPELGHVSAAR
ncbi:MAG TPA: hypothetical protein VFJ07_05885 [Streptosporangiaceae bacterium]|nr:hypothetical protein [Streptosporangiaceae bacterium]